MAASRSRPSLKFGLALLISKDISSVVVGVSLNYESAPHDKWWRERLVTLYDGFRSPTRSAIRRVKFEAPAERIELRGVHPRLESCLSRMIPRFLAGLSRFSRAPATPPTVLRTARPHYSWSNRNPVA
jgi:hypothetical protein